jgi:LmbE family N-acetylglucosaminyl deacetylase
MKIIRRKYLTLFVLLVFSIQCFSSLNIIQKSSSEVFAESIPKKVLIVAPHQDDETLGCAGIIETAVKNGDDVRLLFVTNGDGMNDSFYRAYGVQADSSVAPDLTQTVDGIKYDIALSAKKKAGVRIKEIIDAMSRLGLNITSNNINNKIYYLSYCDGTLIGLYRNSINGGTVYPSDTKHSETYSVTYNSSLPELLDYHYLKFGTHASFTGQNVLTDVTSVINEFRPDDIYVTSPYEGHTDHKAAGLFTLQAIRNIKLQNDSISLPFTPKVHEYMWYKRGLYNSWDVPADTLPSPYKMNAPYNMDDESSYNWDERESVPVPQDMNCKINSPSVPIAPLFYSDNRKAYALNAFISQGENCIKPSNFPIFSDEVFWKRDMSSLTYDATVTANSVKSNYKNDFGQTIDANASNVIDGVILGSNYTYCDGNNRDIFVSDSLNNRSILIKNPQSSPVPTPFGGQFNNPKGVALDNNGNVFVLDSGNSKVMKYENSGNLTKTWGSYGTGNSQFKNPRGIATDHNGYIYIADSGNNCIKEFDNDGNFITSWGSYGTGNGQFNNPCGIAVDNDDDMKVYVVDSGNNRIQKFYSYGTYITSFGSYGTADGQFRNPSGIAVDSSFNVYVVDSGNYRIQKFNSSNVFSKKWGTQGTGTSQFNNPQGIAVDSGCNVYVSDIVNNNIQKFNFNGIYITKWGGTGTITFNSPYGLAIGKSTDGPQEWSNAGHEWVADDNSVNPKITLTWNHKITSNRIILYDRPDMNVNIKSATLTFSDGTTLPVNSLKSNGSKTVIDFSAKTFNWVSLEVTSFEGCKPGLAEFEVYNVTPSYLGDLKWSDSTFGDPYYQTVHIDRNLEGNPLKIGGITFKRGLANHAFSNSSTPANIVYNVKNSGYKYFTSFVGVDDRNTSAGTVQFKVLVDGVEKFNSGILNYQSAPVPVVVDITGSSTLTLQLLNGGDGNSCDWGDWCDAKLSLSPYTYLSDMDWTSADIGDPYCLPTTDKNFDGNVLSIGGIKYTKGLITHASTNTNTPIDITYNIQNLGYKYFNASVGVDDHNTFAGTIQYKVLVDGTTKFDSGIVNYQSDPVPVKIDITGAKSLVLRLLNGGDGNSYDWGDWCDAKLSID